MTAYPAADEIKDAAVGSIPPLTGRASPPLSVSLPSHMNRSFFNNGDIYMLKIIRIPKETAAVMIFIISSFIFAGFVKFRNCVFKAHCSAAFEKDSISILKICSEKIHKSGEFFGG